MFQYVDRGCLTTVLRTEGKLASERGLPDFPPITGNHAFFRCSLRIRGISTDHRQHVMNKYASTVVVVKSFTISILMLDLS